MNLRICSLSSAQSSYDFESPPEPPDDDSEDIEDDPRNSREEF